MAVRTIGTDIKLTGEKEFNDGMKAINSNLKTLRSDMAAVSATFEGNADSVEALTSKNKILQDSVDQQRVKVDALRQMYEKVSAASGENSAAADKWKQQLNSATVALAKEERALRQNNEALEAAVKAADSAENAADDLAEANSDVARTADRAADELDDMSDKAERTGNILPAVAQGFGTMAAGAAQAGAAVLAVGAAMGTAAITALVSFAKESAEAAKAAAEAEEPLSEAQTAWLEYANNLDALDASAAKAKSALGGILLPQLSALSSEGASFLNRFSASMTAAGDNSKLQADVLSLYLVEAVETMQSKIPEYIQVGKDLWGGIKEGIREVAPELMDESIDLVFDLLEGIFDNADALGAGGEMLFDKLKAGLEGRGPDLITSAITLLERFLTGLSENAIELIPVAGTLVLTLVRGLADSLPELGTAAGEMIAALISYLLDPDNIADIAKAALDIGKAFAVALWNAAKEIFLSLVDFTELFGPLSGDLGLDLSTGNIPGPVSIPGHADGLNRVPYDNYLARLHKDEMVLTASEAERYRNGRRSDKVAAVLNLNFNAKTITREDAEMVVDVINEKLGDLIE